MATARRFTVYANQARADAQRKRELGHIHQGRATLGWSEDDYRFHLVNITGKASAADLDAAGRTKVLAHMAALGYRPKTAAVAHHPKRPTPAQDKLPLVRRIRAQLISLDRKPDTYADGIAQQMFGKHIQFFEWCDHDQLHSISTALTYEQRRKGALTR